MRRLYVNDSDSVIVSVVVIVIYRVFIYLKHHVYYVSINSFIYDVSKK